MNISKVSDFTRANRTVLPARFKNGTEIRVGVDDVHILNLADNRLKTPQLSLLLRTYPNLQKLILDRNYIERLPRFLLEDNPRLRSLSVKRNFPLRSVSKKVLFVRTNEPDNVHQLDFLDLSENNLLTPPCLNRIFTKTRDFFTCI